MTDILFQHALTLLSWHFLCGTMLLGNNSMRMLTRIRMLDECTYVAMVNCTGDVKYQMGNFTFYRDQD